MISISALIITGIVVICALFSAFQIHLGCFEDCTNALSAISNVGILVTSVIAVIYAVVEHQNHKDEEKTKILCEYNYRYSTDKNISKVVRWILKVAKTDKDGVIIDIDLEMSSTRPDIYDKEIFMRFFEELQTMIDEGLMNPKDASNMFGFYAKQFHKYSKLRTDITDYDTDLWEKFRKFATMSDNF